MDHPGEHLVGLRGVTRALGFNFNLARIAQKERQRAPDEFYAPDQLGQRRPEPVAQGLQLAARPVLTRLRDESGETASLVLDDSGEALYLDQVESRFELRCRGWVGRHAPLEGTSVGAAFADATRAHVVADAVDAGVTAIACAASGIEPTVGVSIIGPSWRLEERGLDGLALLVQSAARELAATQTTGPEHPS